VSLSGAPANRELLLRGLPRGLVSDQAASRTAVDFAPFRTCFERCDE